MSKQVDERVVSMQFDNKHFESNVKTTMSTLDKLKQKLRLDGASKSLENVNSAAKKVDMNGLASGVETVRTKFSALEVMGVTALANITNSAVNAGKRIVSALTIDPIKSGLQEYETQINAVQTIMANVSHKGKTLEDVNSALDELNEYADLTIYNFTEMTRNIGLFTNAGVGLDESVSAIKGFSNAAAMAGTDATRTAGAMYQLSQAMSSGRVLLRDWMSLEQANITGERFQETIKETARAHGIAIDSMIAEEGNLRDTLKSGWLTADLMAEALNHYTLSTETMTESEIEANKERLRSLGYTEDQITKLFELGTEATNAATKVKTFSQMWGVLQESAQSGWAKTWQIIFGDFEEAKALFTPLTNFLTGIIDKISDARNTLLEGAFRKGLQNIFDKINGSSLAKTAKTISTVTKNLEYYQDMVNKIWRGDYKNQPYRSDLLEAEGHNYKVLQSLVDKGYQYKITTEDVTEAEKKFGVAVETTTEKTEKSAKTIETLTDAKLKDLGLTDDEIREYRALEEQSKKTGKSIEELLKEMEEVDGRTLLIESLKNAGSGLVSIFSAISKAWKEIFPPTTSVQLYNAIKAINEFSKRLVVSEDTADNLRRTFKGLFALLDIISTIVGGPIKIAFKILGKILEVFHLDIWDVTAGVGDAIVQFRDWLDSVFNIERAFNAIMPYLISAGVWLGNMANKVKKWISSCEGIQNISKWFSDGFSGIREWLAGIKEAENIPQYIIDGLVSGIRNGASAVWSAITYLATSLINKLKEVLGIHSPSKVMIAIGGFIIAGLMTGILDGIPGVGEALAGVREKITETLGNIEWGSLFSGGITAGLFLTLYKIGSGFNNLTKPAKGLGEVLESTSGIIRSASSIMDDSHKQIKKILISAEKVVKNFSKVLGSVSFNIKAQAIKSIAVAIAILAGSIWLLAQLDYGKLWSAVGAITVLIGLMAGLTYVVGNFGPEEGIQFGKVALAILAIGSAILLMAIAMKKLSGVENIWQSVLGLIAIVAALGILMKTMGKNLKLNKEEQMYKVGGTLLAISFALLIMVGVIKLLSLMDPWAFAQGIACMALLGVFINYLIKSVGSYSAGGQKAGMTLLAIAGAIGILALVTLMLGSIDIAKLGQGIVAVLILSGIVIGLMAATKLFEEQGAKIGMTMLAIAGAIGILGLTVMLLGSMDIAKLAKGIIAVGFLSNIVIGLMFATKIFGNDSKIALTLLGIAGAVAILGLTASLLGFIPVENLIRGGIAVVALAGVVVGLMAATRLLSDKGEKMAAVMIAIAGAVAILAGIAIILGFMPIEKLTQGVIAVSILSAMMAIMIKASRKAAGAFKSILAIAGLIAVMAGAVMLIATMEPEKVITSVIALGTLMLAMTSILAILSKVKVSLKDAIMGAISLTLLAIPLLAFVGVLALMQGIQNATANALALAGLATVLAVLLIPLTIIGSIGFTGAILGIVALLAMCVPLLALVGILAIMQNVQNAMSNVLALSTLMGAMTAMLVILAVVGPLALVGVASMTALTLLIAAIGLFAVGVGALMNMCPELESFLDKGIDVMIKLAGGIGEMIGAFISAIAESIMAILPKLGASLSMFAVNLVPFIGIMKQVDGSVAAGAGIMAGAIIALTVADLISAVGQFWGVDFPALGAQLSAFMFAATPFIMGLKNITPEDATAAQNLAKLIMAITIADVLQGIKSLLGLEGGLDTFGEKLAGFGESMKVFLASIADLTEEDLNRVDLASTAGTKMAEMAKKVPKEGGWAQTILGSSDMKKFSEGIVAYGEALVAFSGSVSALTSEDFDRISLAAEVGTKVSDLNSSIPQAGGIWQGIAGSQDLASWGEKIVAFGGSLVDYAQAIKGITNEDINNIRISADAGAELATLNEKIPTTDGVWQWMAGSQNIGTWGEGIVSFAKGIADYAAVAKTIDDTVVSDIANTGAAVDELKLVAEKVPSSGGWWAGIAGSKDGKSFGESIQALAKGILDYVKMAKNITEDSIESIKDSKTAIEEIGKVTDAIPDNDNSYAATGFMTRMTDVIASLVAYITEAYNVGDNDISAINKTRSAADAVISVSDKFSKINSEKVSEAVTQINNMTSAVSSLTLTNFSGIDKFIEGLTKIADADLKGYAANMKILGETSLNEVLTAFSASAIPASTAGKNMIYNIGSGMSAGKKSLIAIMDDIVSSVILKASSFTTIGQTIASNINTGLLSKVSYIKQSISLMLTTCMITITTGYTSFYNAGSYLVDGFAAGITDNTYKATAKATKMAEAAAEAAREALNINSPSKVFRAIGSSIPEGFALGIDKFSGVVKSSSIAMAKDAISGTKDAISKIVDVINNDVDSQPTIRPVLDLSEVRSGANAIGGMFSGRTLSVNTRSVGTISAAMANYQNGNTDELVSSIKALRKDISDMPRNTYSINGITYDDGSNVADAIKTLVRAAKVERRS